MKAKILDYTSNAAIIQLPMRKFPGIVLQGDTLSIILSEIKTIKEQTGGNDELKSTIKDLYERFSFYLEHYEKILDKNKIPYPYSKR